MSEERDRTASTALPSSICPMPWVNLSLDVDGSARPCCKFAHLSDTSPYQLENLRETDLAGVWNGEGMRKLRRDFRAGVRPTECSTCWDEEAAGIPSYRQTFVEYRGIAAAIDHDDDLPPAPAALDLKLSNVCNLKCRICGPVASSLWLQEDLALEEPLPGSFLDTLRRDRMYFRSNKVTRSTDNRATLTSWLPSLEYLELTGGEPMLSPENRELIELIATEGSPDRVGILFNTNATVIDDRIVHHLHRFREVKVCLSIDDIGARFEYERSPAVWSEVEANIGRYQELAGPNWHLYAFCSISALNVWYLPEYVRWLAERHGSAPLHLVTNLVHYPRHFSIQVLPPAVKDEVDRRLRRELSDDPTTPASLAATVEDLLRFLHGARPDDAEEWRHARATIALRDRVRSESFAETFPEFAAVLEAADPQPAETVVELR